MKILITGVCSFVGSAPAECLLELVEGICRAGESKLKEMGSRSWLDDHRIAVLPCLGSMPGAVAGK
jgi:nucleoside-diphosphate-sugar epimerase